MMIKYCIIRNEIYALIIYLFFNNYLAFFSTLARCYGPQFYP